MRPVSAPNEEEPWMKFFIPALILCTLATPLQAAESECESLRLMTENFWKQTKGERSTGFQLTPMALINRSPTTTMPQLALVCRKDSNGGTVQVYGDNTPFNAPLSSNECRLVFTLGVSSISVELNDDVEGDEACGTFQIIR